MGVTSAITSGVILFFLWGVLHANMGIAFKLLAGLPLGFLLSLSLLFLLFPDEDDSEDPPFWIYKPYSLKVRANPEHPATRYVFKLWALLLLIWLGALDEAIRHDFSRVFGGG